MNSPSLLSSGRNIHETIFGQEVQKILRVPGRINLIGEHTDYNGGTVLPGCTEQAIYFMVSTNGSASLKFYNTLDRAVRTFDPQDEYTDWLRYLRQAIQLRPGHIPGLNITITSDLPVGAGMSSSSALTCGLIQILCDHGYFNVEPDIDDKIAWAIEAEQGTGVLGGAMDQTTIFHAKKGYLLNLQCQDMSIDYLTFNSTGIQLFLVNSNQSHELISSDYNDRSNLCREAVAHLKAMGWKGSYLVDCDLKHLKALGEVMSVADIQKVSFVVQEEKRVRLAIRHIKEGNWEHLGKLMTVTHWGLSHAFQVSTRRIDDMVQVLGRFDDVHGARIMGGGFGGCVLVLAAESKTDLITEISQSIQAELGFLPSVYPVNLSDGMSYI